MERTFRRLRKTPVSSSSNGKVILNERGLKTLYEPHVDAFFSVILVHGFGVSPLYSWTAENGCCWPTDLLARDLPNGRILSWGWNSNLISVGFSNSVSTATIQAHARGLLADVNRYRVQNEFEDRKIVFIAHGAGGIIVQAALCESKMSIDNMYRNVAGIIFLGTAHRGFEAIRRANTIGGFISGVGLGSKSPLLKQLTPNSDVLQNVHMQFRQVLQHAPTGICSAFETIKTRILGIIVAQHAATFGLADEILLPLDSDHIHLSKFSSAKDINYIRISGVIKQWVNPIVEEVSREISRGESALATSDIVEIGENVKPMQASKPTNVFQPTMSEVQDWVGGTDTPPQLKSQNGWLSAQSLREHHENIESSNSRSQSLPRSSEPGSALPHAKSSVMSNVAPSMTSDGNASLQSSSVDVGKNVIKGVEAAASTTADATTWPPTTVIATIAAGFAGTALGTQVVNTVTARQNLNVAKAALNTAQRAAESSENSANTAKAVFEYNKSKDSAAAELEPRRSGSDGNSSSSSGQPVVLNSAIFPSLSGVSPTFDVSSRRNDDSDDDYHGPTTEPVRDCVPNAHQKDGNGNRKEIENVTGHWESLSPVKNDQTHAIGTFQIEPHFKCKSSSAARTLFDYGFSRLPKTPPEAAATSEGVETIQPLPTTDEVDMGLHLNPEMKQSIAVDATMSRETEPKGFITTEPNEDQIERREVVISVPDASPHHDPVTLKPKFSIEHLIGNEIPQIAASEMAVSQDGDARAEGFGDPAEEALSVLANGEAGMNEPAGLKQQVSETEDTPGETRELATTISNREVGAEDGINLLLRVNEDFEEAEPDPATTMLLEGIDAVKLDIIPPTSRPKLEELSY